MQKAVGFNNVPIVYVKGSAYRIHFCYKSKDDAINIMNNFSLIDKMGVLKTFFYKLFLLYIKMSENTDLTYYQRNKDVILNKAKDYYKNNKKRLREQARNKYRNLSEEDKNKKREYRKNRYHKISEEKNQKLKEYQKIITRQKSPNISSVFCYYLRHTTNTIIKKIVFNCNCNFDSYSNQIVF